MGSISVRRSIQWLPDDPVPVEPTSTVVLTSPGKRFVDIRILLPDAGASGGGIKEHGELEVAHRDFGTIDDSSIDWAFAGTSESKTLPSTPGGPEKHSKWHHLVTNRAAIITPGQFTDEGDMYPEAEDGSVLEKGRMANPATGRETDYEEVWLDGEPGEIPTLSAGGSSSGGRAERRTCVVLEARDRQGTVTGMAVCLGRFCQAVIRQGEKFGLERWSYREGRRDDNGVWACRAGTRSGLWTPAEELCRSPEKYAVGDVIESREGGESWTVIEAL